MSPRSAGWFAALWLTVIYSTLGWVRPLCESLRAQGLLSATVTLGAVGTAWVALFALRRDGRVQPVVPWLPLVATVCGFFLVAAHWGLPEERVHLIQYGLLGVLLGRALPGRLVVALACGWLAGAADEGIQHLLPGRTFDSWDILANGLAVSASLLLSLGGRASWCAPTLLLGAALVLPVVHISHPAAAVVNEPTTPFAVGALDSPEPLPALSGASVLLITVDALRRDVVPPWGGGEVALPAFDRLARESVTAEEGFANAIWTSPGILSLLTGLLPEVHGVQARGDELPTRPQFPLEQLAAAGYRRVGYAADATENYRNLGFGGELDRDEDLTEQSLALLSAEGPSFVWLHLRDIHAPYDASAQRLAALGLPSDLPNAPILNRARSQPTVPRRDFSGRHDWLRPAIRALYLAELVDADRRLGGLLDRLDEEGLLESCLVILTSDHGEELLEHDGIGHASTTLNSAPQPELVHIPYYFRLPGGARGGAVLPGRFEQVDLMPTLFGLVGLQLRSVLPGLTFDGTARATEILGGPIIPSVPGGPTVITSSPCGWQCPEERRGSRVHARVSGTDWAWCRPPQVPCVGELGLSLDEQRQRAKLLRAE